MSSEEKESTVEEVRSLILNIKTRVLRVKCVFQMMIDHHDDKKEVEEETTASEKGEELDDEPPKVFKVSFDVL